MTVSRGLTAFISEATSSDTLLGQNARPRAGTAEPWRSHFRDRLEVPTIQRPHLYRGMLDSQAQWINFVGMPGMGRTTVLEQIAEELEHTGQAYVGIWSNQHASDFYEAFVRTGDAGAAALADELRRLYLVHNSEHMTIIIDDYDLHVPLSFAKILRELFETFPGLRLITSTLNPLEVGDVLGPRGTDRFVQPSSGRLFFTFEEARKLFIATLALGPGFIVPDERTMHAAFQEVYGIPLAVALAARRLIHPAQPPEFPFAQAVQAMRWHILGHYSEELRGAGMGRIAEKLMLMPRFKDWHINKLFPQASASVLSELKGNRTLDPSKAVHAGEYAWADGMWRAALDWNMSHASARLALATKLMGFGDVAGAFAQYLFAGDLAACERLLWQRFLTIYENLAPELEPELLDLGAEALRALPMLRALRSLCEQQIDKQELLQHVANLSYPKRQRTAAQALHSRAVACAIFVRIGKPQDAASQAQDVFDQAKSLLESPALGNEDGLALDQRVAVLEAAHIAVLTLAQLGTVPQGDGSLPSCSGIDYLNAWGDVLQTLASVARGQESERSAHTIKRAPIGYRSLVISPTQCFEEINAYRAIDQEHLAVVRIDPKVHPDFLDADALDQTFIPTRQLRPARTLPRGLKNLQDQLVHVQRGDLLTATRGLQRGDLVEPSATIYESLVLLAQGQPTAAIDALTKISGQWGHRTESTAWVIRSCAHWRKSQPEAARFALQKAEQLSRHAVAQSLSLIPPADAEVLVQTSEAPAVYRASLHDAQARWAECSPEQDVVPPASLTKTEMETLNMLRRGLNTRQIAECVHVSVNTVRTHVRSIAKKLNASGHEEILRKARELQLV